MQRTKNKKAPDLILTADWHLREDTPTAFVGDFQEEQWNAVEDIMKLQQQYNCPIVHTGDLFNHWKPSPWLLSMALKHLPNKFFTIYGNHDLPQHNLDLADKCGVNVLREAGKLTVLPTCHWGQTPDGFSSTLFNILAWHVMTYQGKKPWPGITDPMAGALLRKYPQYDLIVTGHNHLPFVEHHDGRILVNPGGITRQHADQIDFRPRVYLWYAETNTVEPHFLPFTEGSISRAHIELTEERNARIDAFISRLGEGWETSLSFEDNIEAFRTANRINPKVMDIVYKAIES
jgi:DNA repair exonuclease SbcCD nuclease subunit